MTREESASDADFDETSMKNMSPSGAHDEVEGNDEKDEREADSIEEIEVVEDEEEIVEEIVEEIEVVEEEVVEEESVKEQTHDEISRTSRGSHVETIATNNDDFGGDVNDIVVEPNQSQDKGVARNEGEVGSIGESSSWARSDGGRKNENTEYRGSYSRADEGNPVNSQSGSAIGSKNNDLDSQQLRPEVSSVTQEDEGWSADCTDNREEAKKKEGGSLSSQRHQEESSDRKIAETPDYVSWAKPDKDVWSGNSMGRHDESKEEIGSSIGSGRNRYETSEGKINEAHQDEISPFGDDILSNDGTNKTDEAKKRGGRFNFERDRDETSEGKTIGSSMGSGRNRDETSDRKTDEVHRGEISPFGDDILSKDGTDKTDEAKKRRRMFNFGRDRDESSEGKMIGSSIGSRRNRVETSEGRMNEAHHDDISSFGDDIVSNDGTEKTDEAKKRGRWFSFGRDRDQISEGKIDVAHGDISPSTPEDDFRSDEGRYQHDKAQKRKGGFSGSGRSQEESGDMKIEESVDEIPSSARQEKDGWSDAGTEQEDQKNRKNGGWFGLGRNQEEASEGKFEVGSFGENQSHTSTLQSEVGRDGSLGRETEHSDEENQFYPSSPQTHGGKNVSFVGKDPDPDVSVDSRRPASAIGDDESTDERDDIEREPFLDEPRPPDKSRKGWFGKKNKDDDRSTEGAQYPVEPSGYNVPSGYDDDERRRPGDDVYDDEPWADASKATSRWSSIEATNERKIITCLAILVCCLVMLVMLGIGIGIGIAIGRDTSKTKSNPAPTSTTSKSSPKPTDAPTVTDTTAPGVSPTLQPSVLVSSASPSPSLPTVEPTMPIESLLELLIANSFDDGVAVQEPGTPQNNAYLWLSENKNLDEYSDQTKIQRYALATFFYATNGNSTWDPAIRDNGWLTDEPECEWASTSTNRCVDGIYSLLTLDFVGVTGEIPPEVGMLTGLERLSVRSNGAGTPTLTGSLPDSIGALTNIGTIRLNDNEIKGTIPTSVGLLTNLRVLLLTGNALSGQIPTEIGLIDGNLINLDNNELTGPIPTEIFSLSNLTALNLQQNLLTGSIPTEIGAVSNMNTLSLANNSLVGPIPTTMGLLTAIRAGIDFSDNDLSGTIPSQIGFLAAMRAFLVQNNKLTGTVPISFENLTSMRLFRIDGNPAISGELSPSICDLFDSHPTTISYADCPLNFSCPCCTFCCEQGLCICNVPDTTKCQA